MLPSGSQTWREEIRSIHYDSLEREWEPLAAEINDKHGLIGKAALRVSVAGLPPIWFQGNIEHVQPGQWALVISLNHQLANPGEYDDVSKENSFRSWCRHHDEHWYEGFYGPLARLASAGLDVEVDAENLAEYASEHVVFTELCPYASGSFHLDTATIADLVESDLAFQTVARIRIILLDQAEPGLVLINGWPAMEAFAAMHRERFAWRPWKVYESNDTPTEGRAPKRLWHGEGTYDAPTCQIPVFGFPFLRKPRTHNSYAEIGQLADHIRAVRVGTASST